MMQTENQLKNSMAKSKWNMAEPIKLNIITTAPIIPSPPQQVFLKMDIETYNWIVKQIEALGRKRETQKIQKRQGKEFILPRSDYRKWQPHYEVLAIQ